MNVKEVLTATVDFFQKHNIPEPRLDAEVLLAELLGMERIQLYVNFDLPLKEQEIESFRKIVRQRARRVPVAYLTGHKEFMSLDFKVNQNVLIPRPETELLVEEVINNCRRINLVEPNIVDLGTGSGAIAVSLAHYLPEARVLGIDISEEALQVARVNIRNHGLTDRVKVIRGDLLEPLLRMRKHNVDIVVSNPPYISKEGMEQLPPEVKQEPGEALYGGPEGLDFFQRIIPQAGKVLKPGGLLALEIGFDQAEAVKGMLDTTWQDIKVKKDYTGHDRIVLARRKSDHKGKGLSI